MAGLGSFLGKLFGGEGDRNLAVLRAYGKLPFYAEYRRLELSPGTPTAFSRWLDEGRLAWVRSPTRSPQGTTRASRLLIALPECREVVIASIWDSRDSLGRVFPFSFFVVCPPEALGADPLQQWVCANAIHSLFTQLHAELHHLGGGGDFYRHYHKRAVPLRPDDVDARLERFKAAAAAILAADWFAATGLDHSITPADWYPGLLRRMRRWAAQPAAELALSCPLARGASYAVQVVLWLTWLGGLIRRTGKPLRLIVPAEETAPPVCLHVLLRDLMADDYQLLTSDEAAYGFVEHLGMVPALPPEAGQVPPVEPPSAGLLEWFSRNSAVPKAV